MRVTEILRLAGLRPDLDRILDPEWYLRRGEMNHKAIVLADNGQLDPESVDPRIAPYVNAALRFRAELGGELVAHEEEVNRQYSDGFTVTGHFDAIYRGMRVRGHKKNDLTLVDWKTNHVDPATAIQTAAYADMWSALHGRAIAFRCGVALCDTGDYKVTWFADKADTQRWHHAIRLVQSAEQLKTWKQENGIKEEA